MKIVHVSPTFFGEESVVGGAERYAYELAKAMARSEEVMFVSFGDEHTSSMDGNLRVQHIKGSISSAPYGAGPFQSRYVQSIRWADVIHCHQVRTVVTDIALLLGKVLGKTVFVTDEGGGDRLALSYHLPLLRQATALLFLSEYSRSQWRLAHNGEVPARSEVIYGGVDVQRFFPRSVGRTSRVLFVGRILPHKGLDYLLKAIPDDIPLDIVGRVYHAAYHTYLKSLSIGKSVKFCADVSDDELVTKYRRALVTVLPSVYDDCYGGHTDVPELLGLVVLESLACETPVIVTNVASLPEIVEDGVTGFVVPPNDPQALREKIEFLFANPDVAREMGRTGRERVLRQFTWDQVVDRCVKAYRLAS